MANERKSIIDYVDKIGGVDAMIERDRLRREEYYNQQIDFILPNGMNLGKISRGSHDRIMGKGIENFIPATDEEHAIIDEYREYLAHKYTKYEFGKEKLLVDPVCTIPSHEFIRQIEQIPKSYIIIGVLAIAVCVLAIQNIFTKRKTKNDKNLD